MSNAVKEYERWLSSPSLTQAEKEELTGLSPAEIEDRFGEDIAFGTAGLRGVMAMGTNRINRFTVRRAAAGIAGWIGQGSGRVPCVAIAYDSRNNSASYAMHSALVLAAAGVKACLFEALRPTPELSFAVRKLGADAGINITASHNKSPYNGFKAYGPDGGQMTEEAAGACEAEMKKTDLLNIPSVTEEEAKAKGLLEILGEPMDRKYLDYVLSQRTQPDINRTAKKQLKLVYTPLHGAGFMPVTRVLREAGYTDVHTVEEQCVPDGNFPTVDSPNPESFEALTLGRELADRIGADLVLGTDPDSDRAAVNVRMNGGWKRLTGNMMGCLLLDYLLRTGRYNEGKYAVTSIVSTRMVEKICAHYGAELRLVLTGFKYIAETIENKMREGIDAFVMGFEESCGYLTGGYIRDKDAVIASLLIADMATYHQERGKTLGEALEELYEQYGYFSEKTISLEAASIDGKERIANQVNELREKGAGLFSAFGKGTMEDLLTDHTRGLPASNVLLYTFSNGWAAVRPSGTEPKLKVYIGVESPTREGAQELLAKLEGIIGGAIKL